MNLKKSSSILMKWMITICLVIVVSLPAQVVGAVGVTKVTLNHDALLLTAKTQSAQVTATVSTSSGNKSVTWSSSNSSVATVSVRGLVTAKKAGRTTIKAVANDGSGKFDTVAVDVVASTDTYKSFKSRYDANTCDTSYAYGTVELKNGTLVTLGEAGDDNGSFTKDGAILQFFSSANVLQKTIYLNTTSARVTAKSITATSDGGFLIAGEFMTVTPFARYGLLAKYKADGTVAWQKKVTATNHLYNFNSLSVASDGSIYVSGTDTNTISWDMNVFAQKYSSTGTLGWSKTIGGTATDTTNASVVSSNGNFIVSVDAASTDGSFTGHTASSVKTIQLSSANGSIVTFNNGPSDFRSMVLNGSNIYGISTAKDKIYKLTATGAFVSNTPLYTAVTNEVLESIQINSAGDLVTSLIYTSQVGVSFITKAGVLKERYLAGNAIVDEDGGATFDVLLRKNGGWVLSAGTDVDNGSHTQEIIYFHAPIHVSGVELSDNWVGLEANDLITLKASVLYGNAFDYNPAVTWSVDDSSIISVDANGKITAKKEGIAYVTVKSVKGGFTDTAKICVHVPTTSFNITEKAVTLLVGNSKQVTDVYGPANATHTLAAWESSNTKVATVDRYGKITAVGKGTATITAVAKETALSDTVTVTVK